MTHSMNRFIVQFQTILGKIPNSPEKRDLLINLLLLCRAAFPPQGDPYAGGVEFSTVESEEAAVFSGFWNRLEEIDGREWKQRLPQYMALMSDKISGLQGAVNYNLHLTQIDDQLLEKLIHLYGRYFGLEGPVSSRDYVHVFEYLVSRYPWSERPADSNRVYLSRELYAMLLSLLHPKGGTVYDPCFESAGIFTAMADYAAQQNVPLRFYGQEEDGEAWRLGKIQMYLQGLSADLGPGPAYALSDDPPVPPQFDCILGNPPFHDLTWQAKYGQLSQNRYLKYGIPSKTRAGFAWLQHMLSRLKPGGEMGLFLASSTLDSSLSSEENIRCGLVRDDLVQAVVLLPTGMFFNTKASASLWILKNGEKNECGGQVLLIDASSCGTTRGKQVVLSQSDRQRIEKTFAAYQQGGMPDEPGFCTVVATAEILAQKGSLNPRTYIHYVKAPLPSWETLEKQEEHMLKSLRQLIAENNVLAERMDQFCWLETG